MEQNTAQNNNAQFSYPDFSANAQGQPTSASQAQTQPTSDDTKLSELKQNLNKLIEEQNSSVSSQPAKEAQKPEETKEMNEQQVKKEDSQKQESYVQEPKPLPGMDKKLSTSDTATISTQATPPPEEGFAPLPPNLPKFNETLDNIMPEPSKPKPVQEKKEVQINSPQEGGDKQVAQKAQEKSPLKPQSQGTPLPQESIEKDGSLKVSNEPLEEEGELTMHKLLSEAINRNASDLHIAVGYPPVLRVDGQLINLDEKLLSPEDTENLIFSVLSDERKELLEVNREIDFAYTYEGAMNARFRINAYYAMRNLSAAFRLIPSRVKTIEELMLPQMYHQFAKLKQGLILVTGPTGHGKSTTIAAILEAINRSRFCHIVTIEDPIEYVFEGKRALIDQREMNDDTHSWNIALRSALRQDPDVILVGEMRDFETIASAITLAETGHLVFATLHTNSASQTLDRIIDVFPENQQQQVRTQVANTLEAVIAQRLIPLDKGGRRAVSEIMLNNSAVSNLIREGKMHQVDNVIRTSSDIGMKYLERSLVDLVREGVISVQTAQEYAVHPEEVLRLLKA
jgi:twitching motility protein PilT